MSSPRGPLESAPLLDGPPSVRATAGQSVAVALTITNTAHAPRVFVVTALGVDAQWLPRPSRSYPVAPGQSITADLSLRPAEGTVAARYPLAVAVQAVDPDTDEPTAATAYRSVDLVVDAPGQIDVSIDPTDTTAVFGRKIAIELRNTGSAPADVALEPRTPGSVRLSLQSTRTTVPPGQTVSISGRLRLTKPALVQGRGRHTYLVTARSIGAPRVAEGAIKSRPMFGPGAVKIACVLVAIVLWAGLAAVFIPKLSSAVHKATTASSTKISTKTTTSGAPGSNGPGGGSNGGGNGGSIGGGTGGSNGGGNSSGGGSGGNAAAAANGLPTAIALSGTVTGAVANGVHVTLAASSLGDPAAQGAIKTSTSPQSSSATMLTAAGAANPPNRNVGSSTTIVTKSDGAWMFRKVPVSGYYLLSFTKPGYQTVKYLIDPHSAAVTQPMKVAMIPGQGRLSGAVTSQKGLVGGATVTITDGSDTLVTSTDSNGPNKGHWSVDGLSTPGSFLISVSAHHLSTESTIVSLTAGASATVNLTLHAGVTTISGRVTGASGAGLGGATVSATDGATPHTVTTVTIGGIAGHYSIPDLTPGNYTVTISAPGYETLSFPAKITKGMSAFPLSAQMSSALAEVSGTVEAQTGKDDAWQLQGGAGLTLSNSANTYKLTSLDHGSFNFDHVLAGTYTLSAQYFGMKTAYRTVVAKVGKPLDNVSIKLHHAVDSSTATIVGFVSNAVGSGGTLCTTTNCNITFALQHYVTDSADPVKGSWQTVAAKLNGKSSLTTAASKKGPTPYILSAPNGLEPGLYQLTVSSVGFLPGTISVRVPLDQLAAAPEIGLYPANTLNGQVKTAVANGNLATDGGWDTRVAQGQVAANHRANCIWVIPASSNRRPTSGCPQTDGGPKRINQAPCFQSGTQVAQEALLADDGTYKVTNLCDGQYRVYVVISNPAYVSPTLDPSLAYLISVSHGSSASYYPTVDRAARLKVTITTRDATGAPGPTLSTGRLHCAKEQGQPALDRTADVVNGSALFWGVPGGTRSSCDVRGPGTFYRGDLKTLTFLNNHDTSAAATLTAPIGDDLFGRVSTTWGGGTYYQPNVSLTVAGTTGFTGRTGQSQLGHVFGGTAKTLVTNAQGCFVIVESDAAGTTLPINSQVPQACWTSADPNGTSFANDNAGVLQLHSQTVTVTVSGDNYVEAASGPLELLPFTTPADAPNALPVIAAPIPLPHLKLDTDPGGLPFANAQITVAPEASSVADTMSATVDSTGVLTWQDSTLPKKNLVQPGSYDLTVSMPGFTQNALTVLQCIPIQGTAPTCSWVAGTNVLSAEGTLTGVVQQSGSGIATGTPVANASVIVMYCGANASAADPQACPQQYDPTALPTQSPANPCPVGGIARTTDANGRFSIAASDGQFCMVNGVWAVYSSASAFVPDTSQLYTGSALPQLRSFLTIKPGPNAVPTTNDPLTLQALGKITGTVLSNDGHTTPQPALAGANITAVWCPNSTGDASVDCDFSTPAGTTTCATRMVTTSDGNGQFTINNPYANPGSPDYCLQSGTWGLMISKNGWVTTYKELQVGSGTKALSALPVSTDGALQGTVQASGQGVDGQPVGNATVTMQRCDNGASATTGNCTSNPTDSIGCGSSSPTLTRTTDSNGNFTIAGLTTDYCLDSGTYLITVGANTFSSVQSLFLQVIGPGLNTHTYNVQSRGGLAGRVTADGSSNGISSASLSLVQCTVSGSNCTKNSGATTFTTTTDGDGNYSFTSGGRVYFLDPGTYLSTTTVDGYAANTHTVTVGAGATDDSFSLTPLAGLTGTVNGSAAAANPDPGKISGASVSLVQYCGTGDSSNAFVASGCTGSAGLAAALGKCSGSSLSADQNGVFTLASLTTSPNCLAVGWWQLAASATGFDATGLGITSGTATASSSGKQFVYLAPGGNAVTLTLPAKAGLSGSITGSPPPQSGGNLANATVSIIYCAASTSDDPAKCASVLSTLATPNGANQLSAQTYVATTNDNGNYSFGTSSNPYPYSIGEYVLTVTRSGYQASTPTAIFLDSGTNTQSLQLPADGSLSGIISEYTGDDTTSSINVLGGAAITLTLCGTGASQPANCPSSGATVFTTKSAGDGTYSFANGTDGILQPGWWQMQVAADAHQSGTGAIFQISSGANAAHNVNLFRLVSLTGAVSGTVGNTSSTYSTAVSGATVTATYCPNAGPSAPAVADCTGTVRTTTTDTNGAYSFASGGTSLTMQHGYWAVTASATGYANTNTATVVQLASGTDTTQPLSLQVKTVTQKIAVQITSGTDTIDTSHVTVKLSRVDNCNGQTPCTPITLTSGSSSTWVSSATTPEGLFKATGLIPTTYNVVITGDSSAVGSTVLQTFGTLTVPLSDTGSVPDATLPVNVIQNSVTGTITGQQDQTLNATGLANVTVELGTVDGSGNFTVANNVAGHAMQTTTGSDGTFTVAGIPNGTYRLRVNEPDDASAVVDGYVGVLEATPVTVQYGNVQYGSTFGSVGTIQLTRRAQNVFYALTPSQSGDPISGFTPTLYYPSAHSWSFGGTKVGSDPDLPHPAAGTVIWEFSNVPFGCWLVDPGPSTGHTGTASDPTDASSGSDASLSCGSGQVAVRGDADNAATTVTSTLTEYELDLSVTLDPVNASTSPSPTSVTMTVTGNGLNVSAPNFATDGTVSKLWVAAYSAGYTVTATPTPSGTAPNTLWPTVAQTAKFGSGNNDKTKGELTLDESTMLGSINVRSFPVGLVNGAALSTNNSLTITLVCMLPNGADDSITEPQYCDSSGSPTGTDKGAGKQFSNLQPGNWYVHVTGTINAAKSGDPDVTVSEYQKVTVTAGQTAATTSGAWSKTMPT